MFRISFTYTASNFQVNIKEVNFKQHKNNVCWRELPAGGTRVTCASVTPASLSYPIFEDWRHIFDTDSIALFLQHHRDINTNAGNTK